MYVEAGVRVVGVGSRAKSIAVPDHLVSDSAHLVGEAVFVSPILCCCDGDGTGVFADVFRKHGA